MVKVNHNLKIFRIKSGLTQLELANRLGVKERVITFWETGRSDPQIEQAVDIGRILEVDPANVFPEMFKSNVDYD
jgi:DNA-binding XRE family transcriptional regulator